MNILFHFVLAVPVFFLQYVAPFMWLRKKMATHFTALEQLVLLSFLGCAVEATIVFFAGQVVGVKAYWLGYLFFAAGVVQVPAAVQLLRECFLRFRAKPFLSVCALLAAFALASTLIFTWIETPEGLKLQDGQIHDSVWHVALIRKLLVSIPPEHPATYLQEVHNYHYFYDLLIAVVSKNFFLSPTTLYFQFFPLMTSLLFAAAVVLAGRRLSRERFDLPLLFFVFFGGSFAYIIPFILPGRPWNESSFWVSQTFAQMLNPQLIFSLAQTAVFGLLVAVDQKQKRFSPLIHGLIVVIVATSIGFKSYGFVIMSVMYAVYLLWHFVSLRQWQFIVAGVVYSALALPCMWLISGFKSSFFWMPLWYLTSMIESQDRFYYPQWRLLEDYYISIGAWHRVIDIKLREFVIFFVGNLGTRAAFLLAPIIWWLQRKKLAIEPAWVILGVGFVFSAAFPLLFLQRGAVWNSIQFWYYTLVFADFFAAWVIAKLFWLIYKQGRLGTVLAVGLSCLLIALTVPTFARTYTHKITRYKTISTERLQLLEGINAESRVLVCPSGSEYYHTSLLPAITGASSYLVNTAQLELAGQDVTEQETLVKQLFVDINSPESQAFIQREKISSVLCEKIY